MKFIQNILLPCGLLLLFAQFALLPPSPTAALLTQSTWTSTETWDDFDGDGTFALDTIPCRQDNHWEFHADSTFIITEDSLKCEPELTFLDTIRGEWRLENNDTRLTLSFADGAEEFSMSLHAIGPNLLTLYFSGNENPNDPVVRQRVFLHR
jgi:hypothetical protein